MSEGFSGSIPIRTPNPLPPVLKELAEMDVERIVVQDLCEHGGRALKWKDGWLFAQVEALHARFPADAKVTLTEAFWLTVKGFAEASWDWTMVHGDPPHWPMDILQTALTACVRQS